MTISQHMLMRLKRDGLKRTLHYGRHWISERYHERSYRISTQSRLDLTSLGFSADYNKYDPAPYRDLKKIFSRLPLRRDRDEVLVDYGSGAGRVALVAGMLFPFRAIIGVEVVPSLIKLAERNLASFRPKLACRDITFVESDAIDYALPPEATVVFFFNPFTGSVLEQVLDAIGRSIAAAPRPLTIVFLNPESAADAIGQRPWMQQTADFPAHANRCHIYRADPAR